MVKRTIYIGNPAYLSLKNAQMILRKPDALQYPLQRYKFESNSQLLGLLHLASDGCNIHCKDTNLKAIHNQQHALDVGGCVAISTAKIQI